jgi:hypothetical protein
MLAWREESLGASFLRIFEGEGRKGKKGMKIEGVSSNTRYEVARKVQKLKRAWTPP